VTEAVCGRDLSEAELREMVVDHENNRMTRGEIGCSLSHLNIYRQMEAEGIPLALILEDDSVFLGDIQAVLEQIRRFDRGGANIYLLTGSDSYDRRVAANWGDVSLHKIYTAHKGNGYVVTAAAARRMLASLYPVWLEADRWENFKLLYGLGIYCVLPPVIGDNDADKAASSLEGERKGLYRARKRYRNRLLAKKPGFVLKKFLYRTVVRLFVRPRRLV
jgi:glycosyl transferase family 25